LSNFKPRIIAFTCNWCAYAGADLAGTAHLQYPTNIRIIRLMCTGRIEPEFIFEAFRRGADGVLIGGCHPGECHYIEGNYKAAYRVAILREVLNSLGLEPERLRLEWVSASEGPKFAEIVSSFVEEVEGLGPSPLKGKQAGGGG
jgi:F420-non-reducing hydrogenase iron-sulfur subunit